MYSGEKGWTYAGLCTVNGKWKIYNETAKKDTKIQLYIPPQWRKEVGHRLDF